MSGSPRRSYLFTEEQERFFVENQHLHTRADMASIMNERFGLHLKATQVRDFARLRGLRGLSSGRFGDGRTTEGYPVGAERVDKDGYTQVKVAQPDVWRKKAVVVWEGLHGELPEGMQVMFLDGDKTNFEAGNLYAAGKGERVAACRESGGHRELVPALLGVMRLKSLIRGLEKGETDGVD